MTAPADAQAPGGLGQGPLEQILTRLERLEQENRALAEEVRALRRDLAVSRPESSEPGASAATVEERLAVQENRIEEQAQSKVEASHQFPVRLTGMALFNTFLNSRQTGGVESPLVAPLLPGALSGGATLRQTILGFDFRGPETFGHGQVHGSVNMDFSGGSGRYSDQLFRLRTARLDIDWGSTSLMFGQDKPLISPREPTSLASVAYPPLSDSGNLWLWQPQVRLEQRLRLSESDGIRAQIGVYATGETYGYVPSGMGLQPYRPALQARVEFAHRFSGERRILIAPGFHTSTTHVAGTTAPSRLFSIDWFMSPWRKFEFSGEFFNGRNIANLGGLYQGVTVLYTGRVMPVRGMGGWAQWTYLATTRLSFNVYSGQQDNREEDLLYTGISKNQTYAGNLMYRLAPNVIVSFEGGQVRTLYLGQGNRVNNHYDLALAYLF